MGRLESWKNHVLSACRCVTTLLEADSRLLICRTAPRESESMSETRDFYFLTPPCLPIKPLGGLVFAKMSITSNDLKKCYVWQCWRTLSLWSRRVHARGVGDKGLPLGSFSLQVYFASYFGELKKVTIVLIKVKRSPTGKHTLATPTKLKWWTKLVL